jgi:hypothetical protein
MIHGSSPLPSSQTSSNKHEVLTSTSDAIFKLLH